MIKNKINIPILDEQVERLQNSANVISVITGHDLGGVEDMIVGLITPKLPPGTCPYCMGTGKEQANGVKVRCRFCGGIGNKQAPA